MDRILLENQVSFDGDDSYNETLKQNLSVRTTKADDVDARETGNAETRIAEMASEEENVLNSVTPENVSENDDENESVEKCRRESDDYSEQNGLQLLSESPNELLQKNLRIDAPDDERTESETEDRLPSAGKNLQNHEQQIISAEESRTESDIVIAESSDGPILMDAEDLLLPVEPHNVTAVTSSAAGWLYRL
jgi:hypothetical protein